MPPGRTPRAPIRLTPMGRLSSPDVFGPTTRTPPSCAASRSRASRSAPSGPDSPNPTPSTTAPATPRSPQARTRSGTVAAGVQITARSAASGNSSTEVCTS